VRGAVVSSLASRSVRSLGAAASTPTLTSDEVTTKNRIPVTTSARTVLDLAATLNPDHLKRLLDQ
jgi:hypothetical protein